MSRDLIDELMHQAEVPDKMSDSAMIRLLLVISKGTYEQAIKTNGSVADLMERVHELEEVDKNYPSLTLSLKKNPRFTLLFMSVVILVLHSFLEAITPGQLTDLFWRAIF